MRKLLRSRFVAVSLLLAGYWSAPVPMRSQQDAQQTAPPAYTPPPLGAEPAEDTPAQREALAQLKAKAEEKFEAQNGNRKLNRA